MMCPKCHNPNPREAKECVSCGVLFRDIAKTDDSYRFCPWNDHGHVCGLPGSVSDQTHAQAQRWCSDHFWAMKGFTAASKADAPAPTFRKRWYAERGLSYEPPKPGRIPPHRGNWGPRPDRAREPGDDDEELAGQI